MRRKFKTPVLTPSLGHAASQTPRKETDTPGSTLPTRGLHPRCTPFYSPVNYKNGMLINNAYIKTKNKMPSGPPALSQAKSSADDFRVTASFPPGANVRLDSPRLVRSLFGCALSVLMEEHVATHPNETTHQDNQQFRQCS